MKAFVHSLFGDHARSLGSKEWAHQLIHCIFAWSIGEHNKHKLLKISSHKLRVIRSGTYSYLVRSSSMNALALNNTIGRKSRVIIDRISYRRGCKLYAVLVSHIKYAGITYLAAPLSDCLPHQLVTTVLCLGYF